MDIAIHANTAPGARSLQKLFGGMARWLVHGSPNAVLPMQRTNLRQVQNAPQQRAAVAVATGGAQGDRVDAPVRPRSLRVLRVTEPGQARTQVGRMVISGRMADVCAELDRLVAREAALH